MAVYYAKINSRKNKSGPIFLLDAPRSKAGVEKYLVKFADAQAVWRSQLYFIHCS